MEVFYIVLPILIIPLTGFITVRTGILSTSDGDSISKFTFNLLIPAMLFISMAQMKIPADMNWNFLSAYYCSVLIVYVIGIAISAVLFGYSVEEQSVFGMGAAYSNATIVGMPVCIYALGEDALLPLLIIVSIHNLVLFSIGIIAAERQSLSLNSLIGKVSDLFWQLLKNPITGSLIVGILYNFLDIGLYQPLADAFDLFSRGAVPAALFVLGASMNKYQIRGNLKPAVIIVLLKTLVLPLLVWFLAFRVFALPSLWAATALLTSAMPVGLNAYIFSQKYSVGAAAVSTGIVISTVTSILSLTGVLIYIHSIA